MTKKWIAINLIMLMAAGLLGWQLYVSTERFKKENSGTNLSKAQTAKKKAGPDAGLSAQHPDVKLNETDFAVIPAQTLFSEIRKVEAPVDTTPAPEPVRKLDVIPILVGITITGSQKMALINDPAAGNAPGASKIQRMRIGDNYRGFVVTDITNSSLILEYGASREVIPLYDTSKPPAQSGKTPILATRVVNFSGTGGISVATSARPQAVQGGAPAAARAQPGAVQRPVAIGAGAASAPQSNNTGIAPGGLSPSQIDSQGRAVINSPFGQFTLPVAPQPGSPTKK